MNALVKATLAKTLGPYPSPDNWGGALGWIEANHPELYLELWILDHAADGLLFGDPAHSISWNIATRAAAGNPLAKELCQALSLLSPNHCTNVLANEKPLTPSAKK